MNCIEFQDGFDLKLFVVMKGDLDFVVELIRDGVNVA